jgi:hypothetical protein
MKNFSLALLLAACGNSAAVSDGGVTPGQQPAVCQQYLSCAAIVAPGTFPTLEAGYGATADCWQQSASLASTCAQACTSGLAMLHAMNQTTPQCALCQANSDCTDPAKRVCAMSSHECIPMISCSTVMACLAANATGMPSPCAKGDPYCCDFNDCPNAQAWLNCLKNCETSGDPAMCAQQSCGAQVAACQQGC